MVAARKKYPAWTKKEEAALKKHSRNKTPIMRVSREMKRTVAALRFRAGKLRIGLGERQRIA